MKVRNTTILFSLMLAALLFSLAACGATSVSESDTPSVQEPVTDSGNLENLEADIDDADSPPEAASDDLESSPEIPDEAAGRSRWQNQSANPVASSGGLSEEEIEGLVFMREEEKLARDVYRALYEIWGLRIFQNISSSEQVHTDAVKNLLFRYGIEDPMSTDQIGVFVNPDLQALYDQLVGQGSQSLGEALKVGAAIEEIDILDLETQLAATDNPDILEVYGRLLSGSENHLRAFTSTLAKQTGETYEPQYMSGEAYQSIVTADGQQPGGRQNRYGRP